MSTYLNQTECYTALDNGCTLVNDQGFTVSLVNNQQVISNPNRQDKPYKFDYPTTWKILQCPNKSIFDKFITWLSNLI